MLGSAEGFARIKGMDPRWHPFHRADAGGGVGCTVGSQRVLPEWLSSEFVCTVKQMLFVLANDPEPVSSSPRDGQIQILRTDQGEPIWILELA